MTAAPFTMEWLRLVAVIFALGLRHGLDADHLAAIDSLTRLHTRAQVPLARFCGALFSIGHGCIVVAVALVVGALSSHWQTPRWLNASGAAISIGFLAALGVLNLRAVLSTPALDVVALVGLKSRFVSFRTGVPRLWGPALVGALFALSFDTVSQTALFAVAAARFGGVGHALALGLLFVLGMLMTDGINGLWISRLLTRSDAVARIASRTMSLAVGGISLVIAGVEAAQLLLPAFARWSGNRQLAFSTLVLAVALGGFLIGRWRVAAASRKGGHRESAAIAAATTEV